MVLGRFAGPRPASLSTLTVIVLAALTGCGDNIPASDGGGGAGGAAGDGGVDAKDGGKGGGGGTGGGTDARDAGKGGAGGAGVDARDGGDASEAGDGPVTDGGDAGDSARACFGVSFVSPTNNAMLTADDDKNGDRCADGFQIDVQIDTDAPDGTTVNLFLGNQLTSSQPAAGGKVTFANVQLPSSGNSTLQVQFPTTAACTDPSTRATVNVSCVVPACSITKPIITTTHIKLNGVPAAQGGDRTNDPPAPYQTAFEVTTDVDDGQPVSLLVDNALTPATVTTVTGTATGGKAVFAGVTLAPDGNFEVQARCTARNGVVSTTNKVPYTVDSTGPNLTVSTPANGAFIPPSQLVNGAFQVCGNTTSADAIGLSPTLGSIANNFCIAGTTNCAPVTAVGTDACVSFTCPGGAPFSITVALNDDAGNPTTSTITGIACASSLPSVQIISPVSDAPAFGDKSKHLLAATAAQAFRDQQAGTPGAQNDVVACTDRAGNAVLRAGHKGDASLGQIAGPVATAAAVAADGCPAALGFVARFTGVTLPESTEAADGSLVAPTELAVALTDVSTAVGTSAPLDIWVDSVAPIIALNPPANLCGSFHQGTTFTSDVLLATDSPAVTLTITNGTSTDTLTNPTFGAGVATFSSVSFDQGQNLVAAVATDLAGNSTAMLPVPCTVTVGAAPIVTFTAPAPGQELCAAGSTTAGCIDDAQGGTAGWQGSITAHVTVGSGALTTGNVTFFLGTQQIGQAALDGSGNATLGGLTFFDGTIALFAQTDNVPGHGVGSGNVTVVVDTGPPDPPTNFLAAVLSRRETSYQLSWTAPADNGQPVTGYQVRVARVPITAANFDDGTVAQSAPFTGSPAAPGRPDGVVVHRLNIGDTYFFAVAATDAAGNRSTVVSGTAAPAQFKTVTLSGVGTDGVGLDLDGSADLGTAGSLSFAPDGFSDLVVGGLNGTHVYVFFGTASGYATTPSITITGPVNRFGQSVVNAGDLDGDGLNDIAIASPAEGGGKVYIYSRKTGLASWGSATTWPATLNQTQASYVLTADMTFAGATRSIPNRGMARVGNFDSSGSDDLAIAFDLHGATAGSVLIVKGSSSFGSMTIPDPLGAATIEIDGAVPAGTFGFALAGIGQFFPPPAGPTLLTSALQAGAVYAFRGQSPTGGVTGAGSADDSVVGPAADLYGFDIGFLGPLGASPGAVTVGGPGAQYVDVHLGTASTGPLLGPAGGAPAASVRFTDSASGNSFGAINLGGGIKGTSGSVSFLGGDSIPDLVLAGQAETGQPIYIISGAAIPSLSGTVDVTVAQTAVVTTIVKAANFFPTSPAWIGYGGATAIPDSDGDGFADFAIGEFASNKPGRVVVFF
jgi:hypothetical protein